MRPYSALSLLLLVFLFISLSDARTDPGEYWKNIMKGETMPKAIEDLLHHDHHQDVPTETIIDRERFVKDFDTKANVIIYHSHSSPKQGKPSCKHETEKSANHVKPEPIV